MKESNCELMLKALEIKPANAISLAPTHHTLAHAHTNKGYTPPPHLSFYTYTPPTPHPQAHIHSSEHIMSVTSNSIIRC